MNNIKNVPVLDWTGKPLMPTSSAYARILLKKNKAKVIKARIFAIQLLQPNKPDNIKNKVTLGIDTGFMNIGYSVVSNNKELIGGELTMLSGLVERNQKRAMYRRTRRNKLRYRKCRFDNNNIGKGWLPPSTKHKNNTHFKLIEWLCSLYPITDKRIEIGNFDIQKMVAPDKSNVDYQTAILEYQGNLRNAILFRDKHTCQHCGANMFKDKNIKLQAHHIIFRSCNGSDKPSNLITLCTKCHTAKNHSVGGFLHKWMLESKKVTRSLRDATFMNILASELKKRFDFVETFGYNTSVKRKSLNLDKSHHHDAFVIAGGTNQMRSKAVNLTQKRRHNRSISIFKDAKYIDIRTGEMVYATALNCGRTKRNTNLNSENLRQYRGIKVRKGATILRLKTYKFQPKDIVGYNGKRYTSSGCSSKGRYVLFKETGKNVTYPIRKVTMIKQNGGTYVETN